MKDIKDMKTKIDELYAEMLKIQKEVIGEKIKMILEVAREGKKIPLFLELEESEVIMLGDCLIDKALDEGKEIDEYYRIENDDRIAIKIDDILLSLGQGSYYMTEEEFKVFYEETKAEGGRLDDFLYSSVPSIKEEEFLKIFIKEEEKSHDISEVRDTVSGRNPENIKKTSKKIEEGIIKKTEENQGEIDTREDSN